MSSSECLTSSEEDSIHTSDEEFIASSSEEETPASSGDELDAEDDARRRAEEATLLAKGLRRSGRLRTDPKKYMDPDAAKLMTDGGRDVLSAGSTSESDSSDEEFAVNNTSFDLDDESSSEESEMSED